MNITREMRSEAPPAVAQRIRPRPLLRGVVCANGRKLAHEHTPKGQLESVTVGTDRRVRLDYDAEGRPVAYTVEPPTP